MNRPGKMQLLLSLLLLAWFAFGVACAQDARVQAELSKPRVALGESVNLQLVAEGLDGELNTSALEVDFNIVGRSSSRQVNIVNGKRSSTVIWDLEIQPRRVGKLVVPPVSVGPLATRPLQLQVSAAASGSQRQVYLEASVDNVEPYVQAQIIYTLKIYQHIQFSGDSLGFPDAAGITVQQLGGDSQYTEEVDGQSYAVFERRYALFPQSSGRIEIPPVALQGSYPGKRGASTGLFAPRQRFTRQSKSVVLNVKPRPDTFTGEWWLPATALELSAKWVTQDNYVVGQPLTRIITLAANGVSETQLPSIAPPEIPGVSVYADASDATTVLIPDGLQAQREFSWAIIPQKAGSLTLPELTLPWFDVTSGTMQLALVPAETIDVKAAAGTTSQQAQPTASERPASIITDAQTNITVDDKSVVFWQRFAWLLAAGWITTVLAWAYHRYRARTKPADRDAQDKPPSRSRMPIHVAAVEAAVRDDDLAALARSVNAWGAAAFGTSALSPGEIAKRVESVDLRLLLWNLDAALYRPGQNESCAEEFSALAGLLKADKSADRLQTAAASKNGYGLPAL